MSPAESTPHSLRVALADTLVALAHPTRLALLESLRVQSRLSEIDAFVEEEGRERRLARQTVRFHLDALVKAGIVASRDAVRDGEHVTEYFVNHQKLYALSQDLCALARLRPSVEPSSETVDSSGSRLPHLHSHVLVVVKGIEEGTMHQVVPAEGVTEWVIGRSRTCHVALDFDPAVSHENALISWDGASHVLSDLPRSRNGTSHNLRRLQLGERVRLRHGDLIGVGRSLLLYWRA